MQIVNKQTLIASLEESVRELTESIQDAKDSDSQAFQLRAALLDFADEVSQLGPSLDYWNAQDDIALRNEAAIDRVFGNMSDQTLETVINRIEKVIDKIEKR